MTATPCFAAAFAALWLIAGAASPASAEEADIPSARHACRVLAPRFEPRAHARAAEPARFPGGARLSAPVAAPCPRAIRSVEV